MKELPKKAWFAVQTKPRAETLAMVHLQRQGFGVLNCRMRRNNLSRSGLKIQIEPLFPRYVFVHSDADGGRLGPIRSTRGVRTLVRFGDRTPTVPDVVISAILERQDAEGFVQLDPPELRVGDHVKVQDGPFAGHSGIFKSQSGESRVRLLLEAMGDQISIELPLAQLAREFRTTWN